MKSLSYMGNSDIYLLCVSYTFIIKFENEKTVLFFPTKHVVLIFIEQIATEKDDCMLLKCVDKK